MSEQHFYDRGYYFCPKVKTVFPPELMLKPVKFCPYCGWKVEVQTDE